MARTPRLSPRRIASAPERRAAASALTIELAASALGLARYASSPRRRERSRCLPTSSRAADASASDVADFVARLASLRWISAQAPSAAKTAMSAISTPPIRANFRYVARRARFSS